MSDGTPACLSCGSAPTDYLRRGKCGACYWRDHRDRVPCSTCGGPTGYAVGVVPDAVCQECRRADWQHGTRKGYRTNHCRCDKCRAWNVSAQLAYGAKVKERDGVSLRVKYRKSADVLCADCGARLRFGGGGAPEGVSPRCLACSGKRPYIPQSIRSSVYGRDGYACQLCGGPTEPDSDPSSDWYPTLDHITPVSLGGSSEESNLRTAHRWCNIVRGVSDPHGLFGEVSHAAQAS